ncbi:MAG TPA: imidazole glycerol phosphate synthase subunit HisH [Pirellulales bacterium]|nr:imidazole glycerol phosphate synthase subunit HisH [Pirellulales bacterium]
MIVIVDYGMGNLRSVQKGFEKVGHAATVTSDPEIIRSASRVVLPGVGAFGDAMQELRKRELVEPLKQAIAEGTPFLGICLGLQLLFDVSYEGGRYEGLGVLPGEVVRFDLPHEYKVPHMGWNQLRIRRPAPILSGLADGTHAYFVHSYYAVPRESQDIAAETEYGWPFTSVVWRDNVFATQFHPEKSQADGLKILRNFAETVEARFIPSPSGRGPG